MDLNEYFRREPIAGRGISVVIPAFNVEACLERTVRGVMETLERRQCGFEIVLVDDGSTDSTGAIADRCAAAHSRVRVIHQGSRAGYGAALRSAFRLARYPLVWELDAAAGYEPEGIAELLGRIDHCDIVCGFRPDRSRSLRGLVFRSMLRLVFAVPVRDAGCGFRLYRRSALRRIPIQSEGRFAGAELLAKATFLGMLIDEVAIGRNPQLCGDVPRDQDGMVSDLFGVFWRPRFRVDMPQPTGPAAQAAA